MQTNRKTRVLVTTALFAALLAVLSPLAIPVGPVPFTLGILAVCLTGAMLPLPAGLAALAVYILLGCCGLPVFSGFRGGPQVLLGPTGGYIAGYFCIVVANGLARRLRRYWARLLAGLAGLAGCYLLGTAWYALSTGAGFAAGLMVCVVPFALPDIAKLALALGLARLVERKLGRQAP